MKSIYDVAKKLKRYQQVSYNEMTDTLYCESPEYRVQYTGDLITIYYGGKIYEYTVADYTEGYFFFKWLIKGKLPMHQNGYHLTVENLDFLHEKKITKPVGIVGKIIGTIIAAVLIWYSAPYLFFYYPVYVYYGHEIYADDVVMIAYMILRILLSVPILIHVYRRHPKRIAEIIMIIAGLALTLFFAAMFVTGIIYRNEGTQIPLAGTIFLEMMFLSFAVLGIFFIYIGFRGVKRSNPDHIFMRKPQFPPFEQAKALYEKMIEIAPEVLVLTSDFDRVGEPSVTDSKIGGEMYFDKRTNYPCATMDRKGDIALYPILQLNLSEIPENKSFPFPDEGILQLFTSDDGQWSDIVYYKNIHDPIKMPYGFGDEDFGEIYTYGEIPINVHTEKTVFYENMNPTSELMNQAARELGIYMPDELLFRELMEFVGERAPAAYDDAWVGFISSMDGDLIVTLCEACDEDALNVIETGMYGDFTWKIEAPTLNRSIERGG